MNTELDIEFEKTDVSYLQKRLSSLSFYASAATQMQEKNGEQIESQEFWEEFVLIRRTIPNGSVLELSGGHTSRLSPIEMSLEKRAPDFVN